MSLSTVGVSNSTNFAIISSLSSTPSEMRFLKCWDYDTNWKVFFALNPTHILAAEFNFRPGARVLFQVDSQAALDACNFTGVVPIFDQNSSSPVHVSELSSFLG